MPEMQASLRARYFVDDIETQGRGGFADDADKEEVICKLIELIEDAECCAEAKGHEDWDFKVHDLVHAQMLNEKLGHVADAAHYYLRALDDPHHETEEYREWLSLRLKWLRESLTELAAYEKQDRHDPT
jgi:hypothetical protein